MNRVKLVNNDGKQVIVQVTQKKTAIEKFNGLSVAKLHNRMPKGFARKNRKAVA